MILLTLITGISVAIATIAINESIEARRMATEAMEKAEQAALQPPVVHYHAPRPDGLRLPDFIEQMEADKYGAQLAHRESGAAEG